MYNDWFQFTDISFPLLLISRMLSRIQPVYTISVTPIQGVKHIDACLHYRIRWDWILLKQPVPSPPWRDWKVSIVLWRRTRVLIENEKDTRWKSLLLTRKLLLTKNCISNWKVIRRKRSLWKFPSNLTP